MLKIKYFFIVLVSIHVFFLHSQESFESYLEVNYEINYNTEIPITKEGKLYVGNGKSLFIYGKKKESSVESENENSINLILSGITKLNYTDFSSDSIFSLDKLNKEIVIAEKKPTYNWQLINEEKQVDSIKLKKATMDFRGRKYIAWYTQDYAVNAGPWKFNNLPGLIIEIYDTSMRYHWTAKSIVQKDEKKIPKKFFTKLKNTEQITIRDYVKLRYDGKSLINSSRLPRGVSITKNKIPRNSIEIEFEWEKEQVKKEE